MLHNIIEDVVEEMLTDLLSRYDCCSCTKCRKDMMALALNHVPAHYIVTQQGETLARTKYQLIQDAKTDIFTQVVSAVEFVKYHPKHGVLLDG